MNDDLERRLTDWGNEQVPPPDPAFAEALERDLRSQAYFSPSTPSSPRGSRLFRPALVMATVTLVALGGFLVLRDSSTDASEVVMSEAAGTFIELPGEAATSAQSGVVLPDGTRISVDQAGSAVVDGVVLGGGTQAVIVDGRIEILITDPTSTPAPTATPGIEATATPPTEVTPERDAPAPTTPPATDATREPTDRPADRTTPTPASRPTPRPTSQPTERPTPTATPADEPTPTPTPTALTPTPTPADSPAQLTVTLAIERLGPRRALLSWQAPASDDILGWEVVTITGDLLRSVALLRDPSTRALRVERPRNLERVFVVRARGADGIILAESNGVLFPAAD